MRTDRYNNYVYLTIYPGSLRFSVEATLTIVYKLIDDFDDWYKYIL